MGRVEVYGEQRACAVLRAFQDPSYPLDAHKGVRWENCWPSYIGRDDSVEIAGQWHTRVGVIPPSSIEPVELGPLWLATLLTGVEPDAGEGTEMSFDQTAFHQGQDPAEEADVLGHEERDDDGDGDDQREDDRQARAVNAYFGDHRLVPAGRVLRRRALVAGSRQRRRVVEGRALARGADERGHHRELEEHQPSHDGRLDHVAARAEEAHDDELRRGHHHAGPCGPRT